MHERAVQLGLLVLVLTALPAAKQPPARQHHPQTPARHSQRMALECGNLLAFQVLLDRSGFSPGQIDGQSGPNFQHALMAFQEANGVAESGQADCATWQALNGGSSTDTVAKYTIQEGDVDSRYVAKIPDDLLQQAQLPDLGYTSTLERLGERFHSAPTLLRRLNARTAMAAGNEISVPGVEPFDVAERPKPSPDAGDVRIVVSRDDSSLRVLRSDGSILRFAPVTTGSAHDPLPIGDWTIKGVQWRPPFHYNPDLFWDAKPEDTKATIKPGPNNPVGVVWIALNLEHYGLHGTPAPELVGHTASHGCVRLTNWDAARIASLVKPGTPVQFR